jgi:hypothetical protein
MNLIPDGPRELDRQGDAAAAARPERWSAAAGGNHGGGPRSVIPLGLGETPAVPRGKARHVVLVLFCILLPAASVLIELGTRMCADLIFDPLPTPWHVAMALLLPAANAAVFWMTGRDRVTGRRWLGWLNGAAIGVGACYTLLFLPLLPIAVFAILALGIGLLPMGPVFGLVGAIACRARLNHWSQFADRVARPAERPRRVPGLWGGMAAAVVVLVAPHVPVVLTHHGLRMAASNSAAERREGIEFLRRWGSEDAMLRACYRPRSEWRGPWAFAPGGQAVPAWQAQEVFYRVTGTPFEDRPVPSGASRRNDRGWSEAEEQLRGGQTVGSTIDGLSLAGSRMDGTVDPAAATSYTEWTLTFQNRTAAQQEARARVLLPPGGVVSRLTLWIDGEEREAAYGKKAQVRAAYETVVKVQRRDPVLVTSAGPDRVLVQCFPVPPNGTMKTKIGITAPLRLPAADRGALQLPHFLDRNFAIGEGVVHSLWLDGPTPMAAPAAPALTSSGGAKPGVHSLHGDVGEKQLAGRLTVDVPRPAEVTAVWADDPFDKSVGAILQTVESSAEPPPARVVMAVDASASMADALPSVANALAALPPGTRAAAVVAAGEVVELTGTNGAGDAAGVAEQLKRVAARGGQGTWRPPSRGRSSSGSTARSRSCSTHRTGSPSASSSGRTGRACWNCRRCRGPTACWRRSPRRRRSNPCPPSGRSSRPCATCSPAGRRAPPRSTWSADRRPSPRRARASGGRGWTSPGCGRTTRC